MNVAYTSATLPGSSKPVKHVQYSKHCDFFPFQNALYMVFQIYNATNTVTLLYGLVVKNLF
jgi:hypothetical protein